MPPSTRLKNNKQYTPFDLSSFILDSNLTDKDAFALAHNVGGGEGGELFDDLFEIGPLIAEVSEVPGPEVALAIAAAKISAEEVAIRR